MIKIQHFLGFSASHSLVCSHVSVYLFFSIKVQKKPDETKFCTYFYMVVLLAIFTVCAGIMMMTRRNIVSILSGAMFLLSIYYLIRTVPRKLREAVQNQTEFSPMVALVTEKISDGLVFLGGTGITAGLVLFDRSTGSDIRGSIDAVLMPPNACYFCLCDLCLFH